MIKLALPAFIPVSIAGVLQAVEGIPIDLSNPTQAVIILFVLFVLYDVTKRTIEARKKEGADDPDRAQVTALRDLATAIADVARILTTVSEKQQNQAGTLTELRDKLVGLAADFRSFRDAQPERFAELRGTVHTLAETVRGLKAS